MRMSEKQNLSEKNSNQISCWLICQMIETTTTMKDKKKLT